MAKEIQHYKLLFRTCCSKDACRGEAYLIGPPGLKLSHIGTPYIKEDENRKKVEAKLEEITDPKEIEAIFGKKENKNNFPASHEDKESL